MTDRLAQIVRGNPTEQEVAEAANEQGMITMRQDGVLKALRGITSMEEVLRVTANEYEEAPLDT